MKKFIIKDTVDVLIRNRDTGVIQLQGSMKASDIKITKTPVYRYKRGHRHYDALLNCVGRTLTLEETDNDNNIVSEGEYEVSLFEDVIELTKANE